MDVASDIGVFLVRTLLHLFLVLVVVRVLLQIARADFYNPLSQGIVKITNPLLLPLRKVIPGVAGLDMAGIVLAYAIQLIAIFLVAGMLGFPIQNIANVIAWAGLGLISLTLDIYWVAVLIMIVLSFVAPMSNHPAALLVRQLVEPVLMPFRKLLPAMGGLDLSPILFFLSLGVLEILLVRAAQAVALIPQLVLGF